MSIRHTSWARSRNGNLWRWALGCRASVYRRKRTYWWICDDSGDTLFSYQGFPTEPAAMRDVEDRIRSLIKDRHGLSDEAG
jgi:hypothetical protein